MFDFVQLESNSSSEILNEAISETSEQSTSRMAYTIRQVTTTEDLLAITNLFKAYTAWLDLDLTFQDFNTELASLPGKYASPSGTLLLARSPDYIPLGCVALRPMDSPGVCEMKRLYVAPEGRGLGLGKKLVGKVLLEAKRIGYQSIRLDTLPRMKSAVALYEKIGFAKIQPYYETPLKGTLFLEIDLSKWNE
jgi:ribosomal protein S18 acetylase RimI-like enzyme